MVEVKAALVKELRDETNLGMMDCKNALVEAEGDKSVAVKLLRERGLAIAGKKASRAVNEGLVSAQVSQGGKLGVMIEVNCETDFVAKNDTFIAFVQTLVEQANDVGDGELAEAVKDTMVAKVAEIGENMVIRRNHRFEVSGAGAVASYIHLGGKVGVLLEVGCTDESVTQQDLFKETVKDITLHIAACNPQFLARDEVSADVVEQERAIYGKQVEGKPENIIDKIVNGKMDKFYSQICLLEQGFVKDADHSITEWLAAKGKALGDTLEIRRFVRYQVGV